MVGPADESNSESNSASKHSNSEFNILYIGVVERHEGVRWIRVRCIVYFPYIAFGLRVGFRLWL